MRSRQMRLNYALRVKGASSTHVSGKEPKAPRATLVVAPTSLLGQWSDELRRSSQPGTLRVLVWHGQNRQELGAVLDTDEQDVPLVAITSYGTLASEHAKSGSPVFEGMYARNLRLRSVSVTVVGPVHSRLVTCHSRRSSQYQVEAEPDCESSLCTSSKTPLGCYRCVCN